MVEFGDSISAESPAGLAGLGNVENRLTVTILRLVVCVLVDVVFNSAGRTALSVVVLLLITCTSLSVVLAPVDAAIMSSQSIDMNESTTIHSRTKCAQ